MRLRNDEIALAASFFWIFALLVVPLPPFALDLLLSLSMTLALLILLVAIYTERPLDFSVFPSVLLIVTLLRLGLNVASTRLILVHGAEGPDAAGRVIQAFGNITVGGNYLVGLIIFLIFVVINFVVIARGAGRIAEVAARFTLDAMPGKQMAIDADLNQGILDDSEAKQRRRDIQQEADFYGAMDGASKFVKGDAIAALVIMAVNIVGGLLVGVLQGGMPLTEAIRTYTVLTVGDGLVGQVPALITSTSAGIVVSRAAGGSPLVEDIRRQMFFRPGVLTVASVMLGLLALVPGLPFVPFAVLAAATGALSRWTARASARLAADEERAPPDIHPNKEEEQLRGALVLDELEFEIGYGLIPLVDPDRGGELLPRIRALRTQLATELGFIVPLVHIRDNLQLEPGSYAINIRGNRAASGEVPLGRSLAIRPAEDAAEIPGIETREPAYGLQALWIQDRDRERAQAAGYAVVDAATAVATHLGEVIRSHAPELLSRRHVRELLDHYGEQAPKVLEEIVPSIVSVAVLHRALRSLLAEGVSIRDLGLILETLAEYAPKIQDPDLLTDLVRERLARTVTAPHVDAKGTLRVITLDPSLEERLRTGVQRTENGSFLAVEPALLDQLVRGVETTVQNASATKDARAPVLLSSQPIRAPLRQLLTRIAPRLAVLSHNELPPEVNVVSTGCVGVADAH